MGFIALCVLVRKYQCYSVSIISPLIQTLALEMLAADLACFMLRINTVFSDNGLVHHASLPQAEGRGKYNNLRRFSEVMQVECYA